MASPPVRDFPRIKKVKTFIIQGELDHEDTIAPGAHTVQALGLAAIITMSPANIGSCLQRSQRQCQVSHSNSMANRGGTEGRAFM